MYEDLQRSYAFPLMFIDPLRKATLTKCHCKNLLEDMFVSLTHHSVTDEISDGSCIQYLGFWRVPHSVYVMGTD